jgi:hypothetical protein
LLAKWNQHSTAAAGQETEVPDADEAARQHMHQKATQELIDVQSQKSLLIQKLTDHFLKRLDETISDRTRFWRESPDDAAFVAAYEEFSAKSEAVLGQRNRTNATPKWPVLYHDRSAQCLRSGRYAPKMSRSIKFVTLCICSLAITTTAMSYSTKYLAKPTGSTIPA